MKLFTGQIFAGSDTLRRRVLVNTGALASANLWRIIVSFLVQLLVARGLGLEALGQYTVAMAYLNISQVLCEMGLPLWVVRELAQAPHLRRAYFTRSVLVQGAAALLLWLVLAGLATVLPYPPITRMAIFWVGASLPLFAVTSAAATIFQAGERLELTFTVELITNLLILLFSAWLIGEQRTVADLLLVVVVAQGIGMVVALGILFASRLLATPQLPASLSWRQMAEGTLPFFGLSLTDVLLQRLDILLLSLFGDTRLLGVYSAAYNLVRVGIKLLQSLWRGVYPTLARLYPTSPARATHLARTLLGVGLILCVLAALMTDVLATPILRLIYGITDSAADGANGSANGAAEKEAAIALAWLGWQAPLFFIELYATTWLLVIGRAGIGFGVSLFHLLLLTLLLPVGAMLNGAVGAAWGTVAAQAFGAVVALWLVQRLTNKLRNA